MPGTIHGSPASTDSIAVGEYSVAVDATATGNNEIVAAPGAGAKIRVLAYVLNIKLALEVQWRSGATTVLGGFRVPLAGDTVVAPRDVLGWIECAENEALNLNLVATQVVTGHIRYQVMPI